jgi:hypothetical protein
MINLEVFYDRIYPFKIINKDGTEEFVRQREIEVLNKNRKVIRKISPRWLIVNGYALITESINNITYLKNVFVNGRHYNVLDNLLYKDGLMCTTRFSKDCRRIWDEKISDRIKRKIVEEYPGNLRLDDDLRNKVRDWLGTYDLREYQCQKNTSLLNFIEGSDNVGWGKVPQIDEEQEPYFEDASEFEVITNEVKPMIIYDTDAIYYIINVLDKSFQINKYLFVYDDNHTVMDALFIGKHPNVDPYLHKICVGSKELLIHGQKKEDAILMVNKILQVWNFSNSYWKSFRPVEVQKKGEVVTFYHEGEN